MLEKIETLFAEEKKAISGAAILDALYEVKVRFLGKSGSFSVILKEMGKLAAEERKSVGKRANEVRDELEAAYSSKEDSLKHAEMNKRLEGERIDVTLPGVDKSLGSIHPITKVTQEICTIFSHIGFSVRVGPHIERDFYNFDALNIPPDHSARDLQDTFYVKDGVKRAPGEVSPWILRTHTSPVQIRT